MIPFLLFTSGPACGCLLNYLTYRHHFESVSPSGIPLISAERLLGGLIPCVSNIMISFKMDFLSA